jgi:8-hydroxy-5-deazaflavin:NADPH oxidoreductase
MKIGLLGGGSVGEALGVAWAKQGHEILFGVGHPDSEEVEALLARCGPAARAGTLTEAARFGEVLAVALPWQAAYDVLPALDLTGKIVIDCSNPLTNLPEGVASGAEALARRSPGARFAKAFNTTGAENMADPHYPGGPLAMLYCGDDAAAKQTAQRLIKDVGFEPCDLGPLSNAPLMEAQAQLWIWLASRGGLGRNFGFRLEKRGGA